MGLELMTADGHPATRLRVLARATLVWAPSVALTSLALFLIMFGVRTAAVLTVAVRTERRAALWTTPLANPGNAVQIKSQASSNDGNEGLAWTPDGRLVYVSDASGNPDIWIMRSDGSRRVQLTSNAGRDVSPRVTSDGRYIVFASDRDGAMRGWRMAVIRQNMVRCRTSESHPALISRSGQSIAPGQVHATVS